MAVQQDMSLEQKRTIQLALFAGKEYYRAHIWYHKKKVQDPNFTTVIQATSAKISYTNVLRIS
jgi:hypothetical protein